MPRRKAQDKEEEPVARPVGRPRVNPPRPPSEPTGRYVECTANRHFHEPRLVPIKKGPAKFHVRCTCTCFTYMPAGWKADQGYTLEQAIEMAKKYNWQIVGQ